MKKIIIIIMLFIVITSCWAFGSSENTTSKQKAAVEAANAADIYATSTRAYSVIPVPQVSFFVERKTLAEWVERWDKPSVVTYVYLFAYGNCIGYYVCNGKPAATTNYLVPEYQNGQLYSSQGGYTVYTEQTMDLDGTYGANNPGIRFFTASGIAVEWAGAGASYLYSDAILPLNVPKLGE